MNTGLRVMMMVVVVPLGVTLSDTLPSAVYNPADTKEGVLWGVGQFDGRPEDELAERVLGQYPRLTADGEVVTIRSVAEFPQVIQPGQSFVIHLGDLPRGNLVLRLAVTASFTAETEYFADPGNRNLRVLFNDHLVWHRWVVDGHARIETFVPPPYVEAVGNVLVIENEGTQAMAFDALRLALYEPGGALMAALAGGHAQPGSVAAHLRQAVLRLDAPRGAPARGPKTGVTAPGDFSEAWRAYRALREGSDRETGDTEGGDTLARWEAEIAAALRRGVWPVVEVRGREADEAAWRGYAGLFGGMVQAWVLHSPQAAEWVRDTVADARIYGVGSAAGVDNAEGERLFDGAFATRFPEAMGGRIDRMLGRNRAGHWAEGREPPVAGVRLTSPPGFRDMRLQRRDAAYTVETMVQWWMAGGDLLVLDGGEPGGTLFPAVDGTPSPIWEAARWAFALSDGRARRAACSVVPVRRERALGDTHWVAAENGDDLVTLLLMPSRPERGRDVRVTVPVPWQGATAGVVDGVEFGNWRTTDVKPLDAEPLRTASFFSRSRRDDGDDGVDGAGEHGHVILELELDGLTRVRLWPEGHPPMKRAERLRRLPAAVSARPETLRGVFRTQDQPPPAGYRYETLRGAGWLAGPQGGGHTAEVRPATRGRFPAWRVGAQFHGRDLVDVANAVPWEGESLVITFRPDSGGSTHGFQLFQSGRHTWQGAWGMMVYVRARLPEAPPTQRRGAPPSSVLVWMGSRMQRERVELPVDEWRLVTAPFADFTAKGGSASTFYLWPDDGETRVVEVEINGMTAVYSTDAEGVALAQSRAAVQWSRAGDRMWLLVEGPPGEPAAQLLRLERPAHIRKASVVVPKGYPGVRVMHRPDAQWLEVRLPALPEADRGVSEDDARSLFPRLQTDASHTRILIDIELER